MRTRPQLKQKRFEHSDSDAMLDALSAALFKTTGDASFKVEEKAPPADEGYGTRKREKYVGEYKYHVPQLGDVGSSTADVDDTNA